MASSIDPPRPPLPTAARALAEAALQRQNLLTGATGPQAPTATGAPASPAFPLAPPAPGTPAPLPPLPSPPPLPTGADRVSLSPQAQDSLRSGADQPQAPGAAAARSGADSALAGARAATAGAASATTVTAASAPPWPTQGVGAPLQHMLGALLRQLTGGAPQRVVAAQAWPAGMAALFGTGDGASPALPPLHTWLVAQGQAHTPQGARGFALTLQAPAAWAQATGAGAGGAPASGLQVPFGGAPQALASGLYALLLQPASGAGPRTSALLALEFTPWAAQQAAQQAAVYGRELLQPRADPWLQMAALQASGQWRTQDEAALQRAEEPPCATPGCPYAGRAPCEQPFCLAQRVLPAPPADAAPPP